MPKNRLKNSEKQIESTESQLNLAAERLAMQVISQSDYAQVKSQLCQRKAYIWQMPRASWQLRR